MRLEQFTGEGIHGFLDLEIKFFKDLTFLIGINGCGKTTALDAIVALITPSLKSLGGLSFKNLRIDFENQDKRCYVEATREGNSISLRTSEQSDELTYSSYISDPEVTSYRESEHQLDYYRDLLTKLVGHPVIDFINRLPTPMFLGLNRRTAADEVRTPLRTHDPRAARLRRNIFSGSLSQGVVEAILLAETQCRDSLIEVGKAGDSLRRDMLIELLTVEKRSFSRLSIPAARDLKQIPEMRRTVDSLALVLGLPRDIVRNKLGDFLDVLEDSSAKIPPNVNLEKTIRGESGASNEALDALLTWSVNLPEIKRINTLSEMVKRYNETVNNLTKDNTRYIKLLSKFLEDSNKEVVFDEKGYIKIYVTSSDKKVEIFNLSSGESQIFIILTHLFFNPQARSDNVFIVDELELSLHVQWQELFVESLRQANPNIQYIMATHSPSIILDKAECCVDVKPKLLTIKQEKKDGLSTRTQRSSNIDRRIKK